MLNNEGLRPWVSKYFCSGNLCLRSCPLKSSSAVMSASFYFGALCTQWSIELLWTLFFQFCVWLLLAGQCWKLCCWISSVAFLCKLDWRQAVCSALAASAARRGETEALAVLRGRRAWKRPTNNDLRCSVHLMSSIFGGLCHFYWLLHSVQKRRWSSKLLSGRLCSLLLKLLIGLTDLFSSPDFPPMLTSRWMQWDNAPMHFMTGFICSLLRKALWHCI